MSKTIVVFITAPSIQGARAIGKALVEEKLAACANLIPQVSSIFAWKGKLCRERECLMILKTRRSCFNRLVKRVKSLHAYAVPEIIALPIIGGSKEYLRWLRTSTH